MTSARNIILLSFFTAIISTSCISESKNNSKPTETLTDTSSIGKIEAKKIEEPKENFRAKFQGSYIVETKGITTSSPVEVYNLHENGKSQWLFIEVNSKGATNIRQTKEGTWTATDNSVSIKIKGNTEEIIEEFRLKNKVLTNVENSKRHLKLTN